VKLPDLKRAFIRRAYWTAPGVRQALAWARQRPTLGPLVAKADAKLPPPESEGWLDDVLPARAAQGLRRVSDWISSKTGAKGKQAP
jgi:hypothetical protein